MSNFLRIVLVSIACPAVSTLASADDWPQWRGPNRDGVWHETGLVDKFAGDKLKLRWRVPVAGGYSGPTVADGRVYVTDRVVEPKNPEPNKSSESTASIGATAKRSGRTSTIAPMSASATPTDREPA